MQPSTACDRVNSGHMQQVTALEWLKWCSVQLKIGFVQLCHPCHVRVSSLMNAVCVILAPGRFTSMRSLTFVHLRCLFLALRLPAPAVQGSGLWGRWNFEEELMVWNLQTLSGFTCLLWQKGKERCGGDATQPIFTCICINIGFRILELFVKGTVMKCKRIHFLPGSVKTQ